MDDMGFRHFVRVSVLWVFAWVAGVVQLAVIFRRDLRNLHAPYEMMQRLGWCVHAAVGN
jgi:hypothetical protein